MNAKFSFVHVIGLSALIGMLASGGAQAQANDEFADLDLMDLMKVELVSSSKFKQELSDIAAAAYVITEDEIRDSGATNLPELLAMVPGISVSESSANSWAIGVRGFNSVFANKVLVMIDGRSLFSPLFSGVFWEQVDLFLPDIERIEVIRGVGSTVWGANAVNGIINIITKSTLDNENTQLFVKSGSAVNYDAGLRFGTQVSEQSYARFYLKSKDIKSYDYALPNVDDSWDSHAVGGKWELFSGRDSLSLSADWVEQDTLETALSSSRLSNNAVALENSIGNVSFQWQRQMSTDKAFTLAAHWQSTDRKGMEYSIDDDMLNLEFDTSIRFDNHALVVGFGARRHDINFVPGTAFSLSRDDSLTENTATILSAYIQDEWQMTPGHYLQVGTKFESHRHNRPGDFEYEQDLWLPTIRYRMDLSEHSRLWMALSSTARIPSISEHIIQIPVFTLPPMISENPTPWPFELLSSGNDRFIKEKVKSLEIGYRSNINASNRIDVVWFHNHYKNTRSFILYPPQCASGATFPMCLPDDSIVQLNTFENQGRMESSGMEFSWQSRLSAELGMSLSYSYFNQVISAPPPHIFEEAMFIQPRHQLAYQLDWQIAPQWNLHLQHKYIAGIDDSRTPMVQAIEGFLDHSHMLDVNVSFDFDEQYRLMLGVDNLLNERGNQWAPEFPSAHASLSDRRVFFSLDVRY